MTNLTDNVICYFCKGIKLRKLCEVVRTKDGARAFKCATCIKTDKRFKKERRKSESKRKTTKV